VIIHCVQYAGFPRAVNAFNVAKKVFEQRGVDDMPSVVLIGTLDTKGEEYAWLRNRLVELGSDVLVVDAGLGDHDHDRRSRHLGTPPVAARQGRSGLSRTSWTSRSRANRPREACLSATAPRPSA
jgi:hypothetical protein